MAPRRGQRESWYFNALAQSGDAKTSRAITWVSAEPIPTQMHSPVRPRETPAT